MLDRILSPFINYWYWAQERETPLTRGVALAAPLVAFGLILYLLFVRGGDGSSFSAQLTTTPANVAAGTQSPQIGATVTSPAGSGTTGASAGQPTPAATVVAASTAGPAPTAFTQMHYTVVAGDVPSVIAEKVGVPVDARDAWIEEMLALNGVTATTLQVGQVLILPPF
jgi:LysM repeat protein